MGIDKNQLATLTAHFQTQYGLDPKEASKAAKAAMASIRVILVVSTGDRLVFMHSFPFGEELNINGLIFTGDFTRTLGLWLWQQSYGHGTIAGV